MPTYEYKCKSCNAELECEQPITEAARVYCPACGAPELQRLISGGVGFKLEGRGWSSDGYGPPKD